LAERQHGVVSIRQLAKLGFSRKAVAREVANGRLHHLYRGVYAVGHPRLTWHGRCLAAVLACAPSVASHTAAGWVWGLTTYAPDRIHLTATSRRHRKAQFIIHFAQLAKEDQVMWEGIPVTSWPRTLLDLAALERPERLGHFLKRAEDVKLFDLRPLDALLARTTRHPGHAAMRRALTIYRPRARVVRSGVEERFLEVVRAAGLPPPATNFVVGPFELDAYWEAERFAVELDVFETHGSRASFESDREREDDLLLLGVETIRVTASRLEREPAAVAARVAAHLRRRRESP
jgi:very-short-patch-repair endonuclease